MLPKDVNFIVAVGGIRNIRVRNLSWDIVIFVGYLFWDIVSGHSSTTTTVREEGYFLISYRKLAQKMAVFPLYAALKTTQQQKVFEPAPEGERKVLFLRLQFIFFIHHLRF